jgi:hypothetical protein
LLLTTVAREYVVDGTKLENFFDSHEKAKEYIANKCKLKKNSQESNRNLLTSGLDSGSSWLDGVNGILMQQEPDSPKKDYWNRRAIASLANTLITVVEPVPKPLLSSMLLLQL